MRLASVLAVALLVACSSEAQISSALVSPYLKVQVALAADSTDGVVAAAGAIAAEAKTLGATGESLVTAAEALAGTDSLKAARVAFVPLSDAFIEYAGKVGLGDLKVAYCPMMRESWIQADGSIANPYYGSMMLTCGSFQ